MQSQIPANAGSSFDCPSLVCRSARLSFTGSFANVLRAGDCLENLWLYGNRGLDNQVLSVHDLAWLSSLETMPNPESKMDQSINSISYI